jgi:hypothetical protein
MLARLTPAGLCLAAALTTILIEGVTVALRFGIGLRSDEETRWLARYTGGHRVHHAYLGVVLMLVSYACESASDARLTMVVLGAGIALSDLVHHYLVLWPLTGSPEFNVRYPAAGAEAAQAD